MEEESGARKPVTRLRRRLSVEQNEDVKSPSTPSTPTKRRGTRVATKPQLDLINENRIAVASPIKATNKLSKDIIDTPEERSVTPSRRSSRVKSNASDIDEKTLTPSRRSARNKSTSSTTVEATQSVGTSRSLRASRRNSQIGSDTEISATPGKKTRIGRRDSVSSIDSQGESGVINKVIDTVTSVTEEKIENTPKLSTTAAVTDVEQDKKASDKKRKSPRLTVKIEQMPVQHKDNESSREKDAKMTNDNNDPVSDLQNISTLKPQEDMQTVLSNSRDEQYLHNSSETLNIVFGQKPQKNKSESEYLQVLDSVSSTRHRTRSWTTISSGSLNDGNTSSGNENSKAINKRNQRSLDPSDFLSYKGSGDMANINKSLGKFNEIQQKVNVEEITNTKTKKKKNHSESSFVSSNDHSINECVPALSLTEKSHNSDSKDLKSVLNHENKENILDSGQNQEISATDLLAKSPPKNMKSTVYIEDSDSNADILMKVNEKQEDQCVPVVDTCDISSVKELEHKTNNNEIETSNDSNEKEIFIKKSSNNDSCEPMDIDETYITNISVGTDKDNFSKNSFANHVKDKEQEIIKLNSSEENKKGNETSDSHNFSSRSASQVLEKSNNENKSTLILSVKDNSASEMTTPKPINNFLSKSITAFDAHDKLEIIKRNNSLNELSATPLTQKKVTMQTSTPVFCLKTDKMKAIENKNISENNISLKDEKSTQSFQEKPNKKMSNERNKFDCKSKLMTNKSSNRSQSSEDEISEESSSSGNNFFDDAAAEASDDYESGDSRNEDEKLYEEENEIIDKGETLTSEDDISHDSDYEKDSFVVSSDAEDYELLSGSGDDLSMSDNQLSMSKNSKKKFNARKKKEQKKASKEMYESRHKLDNSSKNDDSVVVKSKKYNRQRLDSTLLETEDDVVTKPNRSKRLRLNSTQDTSALVSTVDHPDNLHKNRREKLSQSACDNKTLDEKELTNVCDESIINKIDPLSLSIKPEPRTPKTELDISTVNFTVREDIEEIQLDENVSVMKSNEFLDPLQSDDSSDSANEKFNQEYNSVLEDLKKQSKTKSRNISLNLDKEPKPRDINPIINQLNLTQTKKKKSIKNVTSELIADTIELNTSKKKDKSKNNKPNLDTYYTELYQPKSNTVKGNVLNSPESKTAKKLDAVDSKTDDESSDAIDFQLLFPEDSNDSDETKFKTIKKLESSNDITEDFIPLKKSEAKTDIRESIGNHNSSLNKETVKRNKKRKLSEIDGNSRQDEIVKENRGKQEGTSLPVDIVINGKVNMNASIIKSASKKNTEIKEKKSVEEQNEVDMNVSINKSSSKKKKDLKENKLTELQNEANINVSINKSADKKKHVEIKHEEENTEGDANVSIDKSVKEKMIDAKRKLYEEDPITAAIMDPINKSPGKNKSSIDENRYEEDLHSVYNNSITKSADKKKKDVKEKEKIKADTNAAINKSADKRTSAQENLYQEQKKNEELILSLQENTPLASSSVVQVKSVKNKKRKRSENDENEEASMKIMKENYFQKIHVPRLPPVIVNQLEEKPAKDLRRPDTIAKSKDSKRNEAIATTHFVVEETKKRKLKPSNYLEESVYLNVDQKSPEAKRQKKHLKRPKVLPFMPTVSTSASGYTTNFKVNVIPQETQFVAQKSDTNNFRNDYLHNKKIKRLGTYELYKRQMTNKLSKF